MNKYIYHILQHSSKNPIACKCVFDDDKLVIISKINGKIQTIEKKKKEKIYMLLDYLLDSYSLDNSDDSISAKDIKEVIGMEGTNDSLVTYYKMNLVEILENAGINDFFRSRYCLNTSKYSVEEFRGVDNEYIEEFSSNIELEKQMISVYDSDQDEWQPTLDNHSDEAITRYFMKDNNTCLIIGSGGMGKTEFMKRVYMLMFSKKNVYPVSLPHLLQYSSSHNIRSSVLAENAYECGGKLDNDNYTSYIMQYLQLDRCFDDTLFLFDGLNELEDLLSNKTASLIKTLYREIADFCKGEKCKVIMTSRNEKSIEKLTIFGDIEYTLLRPEHIDADIDNDQSHDNISKMLRRPLFYNMYKKIKESGIDKEKDETAADSTVYSMMLNFFRGIYCQSMLHDLSDDSFEKIALYMLLMPLIAHRMHMQRESSISLWDFEDIVRSLNSSEISGEIAELLNYRLEYAGIDRKLYAAEFVSTPEKMLLSARNSDLINIANIGGMEAIEFSHQEWRDFFGVFYVLSYLSQMKDGIQSGRSISGSFADSRIMPSFNLPDRIQDDIREQTGLYSYNKDLTEEVNKEYSGCFSESFPVPREFTISENVNATKRQLKNIIHLLFTAYEFYDHFGLHHYEAMEEMQIHFYEHMTSIACDNDLCEFVDDECLLHYGKSLAALAECERREERTKLSQEICEFALNKLGIRKWKNETMGEKMLTYRILKHQKAKAMLFESRLMISQGKTAEGKEQYDDAVKLLEENAVFNMSANLLGCMKATPIKHLIDEGERPKPCEAADIYSRSFENMTSKKRLFHLNGTELIYTGRQLINLMMKGYIQAAERSDGTVEWKDNKYRATPTDETLRIAERILEKLEGQEINFLNWDRAMILLYRGKEYGKALRLLITEYDNIMTKAILLSDYRHISNYTEKGAKHKLYDKQFRPIDKKIENTFKELSKKVSEMEEKIGNAKLFDATDTFYYMYDLETLCRMLQTSAHNHVKKNQLERIIKLLESSQSYVKMRSIVYPSDRKVN